MHHLPETGYLRLSQIIGQPAVTQEQADKNRRDAGAAIANGKKPNSKPKRARPAVTPIIPVGKTKWWAGVAAGVYPKPSKALGPRTTVWRVEDIRALVESPEAARANRTGAV